MLWDFAPGVAPFEVTLRDHGPVLISLFALDDRSTNILFPPCRLLGLVRRLPLLGHVCLPVEMINATNPFENWWRRGARRRFYGVGLGPSRAQRLQAPVHAS